MPSFHLKVRMGEIEVELGGDKTEVISAINELPFIIGKVIQAFDIEAGSHTETITRTAEQTQNVNVPKINKVDKCGEAVVSLLTTEWGKTPRAIRELREAMEANAIFFPKTTLSGVLVWLVKKGRIRRWKDKKKGYLYARAYLMIE